MPDTNVAPPAATSSTPLQFPPRLGRRWPNAHWLLWLYSATPFVLWAINERFTAPLEVLVTLGVAGLVLALTGTLMVLYELVPHPRWELPVAAGAVTCLNFSLAITILFPDPTPVVENVLQAMKLGWAVLMAFATSGMSVRIVYAARKLVRNQSKGSPGVIRVIRSVRARALQAERLSIGIIGVMLALVIAGAGVSVGIALVEQNHREAFFEQGTHAFTRFSIVADSMEGGVEKLRERHVALIAAMTKNFSKAQRATVPKALSEALAKADRPDINSMTFDELWEDHRTLVNTVQAEIDHPPRTDLEKVLANELEWAGRVNTTDRLPTIQSLHRAAFEAREALKSYEAAASKEQLPWAEVVSRVTIAALTLFLVQIFFNMYRYTKRRADWLVERVEALEMLSIPPPADGRPSAPAQVVAAYAAALERAAPEFAAAPMPAVDQLLKALRSAVGAVKPEAGQVVDAVGLATRGGAEPREEK